MIPEILFIIVVLSLIAYLTQRRPPRFPPGPIGIPILGNLPFMGPLPHIKLGEIGKKYGSIFSLIYGTYKIVILNDLQVIRDAFKRDVFSGRPNHLLAMKLSADGITFSDGPAAYEQRRFALKTLRDFGFGKQSMEKSIQEEVQSLIEYLRLRTNKPVDLKHTFGLSVINALWALLAGEKFSLEDTRARQLYKICIEGFIDPAVAGSLWFLPWLAKLMPDKSGLNNVVKAVAGLRKLMREVLDQHKETYIEGVHRDFVDVYLSKINETTDPKSSFYKETGENNLIHVLIDLFTAGSDTLNSTLNFAILYMTTYPRILRNIQDELDHVVGRNRLPDAEDRRMMPYTEAVISEIFRFSSIVCGGILHSTTEDVEFQGYFLPKGTIVMGNIYNVHHDVEYWKDPEDFRPDRFLVRNTEGGLTYQKDEALIPFSTGKRICLAENMAQTEFFLFFTGLVQHFDFNVDPRHPLPDWEALPGLVLSTKDYKVVLTERL